MSRGTGRAWPTFSASNCTACSLLCLVHGFATNKHMSFLYIFVQMQVFDTPAGHVTRDYREGLAQLGDLQFRVIDTSGLEPAAAAHTLQVRGLIWRGWGWLGMGGSSHRAAAATAAAAAAAAAAAHTLRVGVAASLWAGGGSSGWGKGVACS